MIGDFLTIKITEAHINIQLEVINGDLKVSDKYIPYSTTCHKSKKTQIFWKSVKNMFKTKIDTVIYLNIKLMFYTHIGAGELDFNVNGKCKNSWIIIITMIYLQLKLSQLLKTCVYCWIHHYRCIKIILEITYYIKKIKQ